MCSELHGGQGGLSGGFGFAVPVVGSAFRIDQLTAVATAWSVVEEALLFRWHRLQFSNGFFVAVKLCFCGNFVWNSFVALQLLHSNLRANWTLARQLLLKHSACQWNRWH